MDFNRIYYNEHENDSFRHGLLIAFPINLVLSIPSLHFGGFQNLDQVRGQDAGGRKSAVRLKADEDFDAAGNTASP